MIPQPSTPAQFFANTMMADEYGRFKLLLTIEQIWKSSDDINEELVEELL